MIAAQYTDLGKELKGLVRETAKTDLYGLKWEANIAETTDFGSLIQFPKFNWTKFPFFVISEKDNLFIYNSRTHTRVSLNAKGKPLLFFRHEKSKVISLFFLNEKVCKIDFDP
jgi:hypothetical protein